MVATGLTQTIIDGAGDLQDQLTLILQEVVPIALGLFAVFKGVGFVRGML